MSANGQTSAQKERINAFREIAGELITTDTSRALRLLNLANRLVRRSPITFNGERKESSAVKPNSTSPWGLYRDNQE